jgi:hypothetical protein
MSCGSRATQVKPEALVILFRATLKPHFLRGLNVCVRMCRIPYFHQEIQDFFRTLYDQTRTSAQDAAESALRGRMNGDVP